MNLDAYPLVLKHDMIKNADDLLEIILKLGSSYSGIELYQISKGYYFSIMHINQILKKLLI